MIKTDSLIKAKVKDRFQNYSYRLYKNCEMLVLEIGENKSTLEIAPKLVFLKKYLKEYQSCLNIIKENKILTKDDNHLSDVLESIVNFDLDDTNLLRLKKLLQDCNESTIKYIPEK